MKYGDFSALMEIVFPFRLSEATAVLPERLDKTNDVLAGLQ